MCTEPSYTRSPTRTTMPAISDGSTFTLQHRFGAERFAEPVLDLVAKRVIERRGDANFDVGQAAALGVELLQPCREIGRTMPSRPCRDEHFQEVEHFGRRPAAEHAVEQLLLLLLAKRATS